MPIQKDYRFGYSGKRYTFSDALKLNWWAKVHPEVRKRVEGMLVDCPYDLGVGGGWRSSTQQEKTFFERTIRVPCSQMHAYTYKDNCYILKPGMAPIAVPGNSYHESTDVLGYGYAVDLLNGPTDGKAIKWAIENNDTYWLTDFERVGNEPWHFQPREVPVAKRNYRQAIHTLKEWRKTPPTPPNPPGDDDVNWTPDKATVANVKDAPPPDETRQNMWNDWAMIAFLKTIQKQNGITVDGLYGPQTAAVVDRIVGTT